MKYESPIVVEGVAPTAAIIWLHGLGADGHDFVPIVPALKCDDLAVRFVFPHACPQPVSIHDGSVCRSWFDIHALEVGAKEDLVGLQAASSYIASLIDEQVEQGIPAHRIILVGFSQGGALALFSGLTYHQPLAGILGLSTVLAGAGWLETERTTANEKTPIWLAHGEQDVVITPSLAEFSRDQLEQWGYAVAWRLYPMAHTVIANEIAEISQFIRHVLTVPAAV